jgi:hypothetical protein
MVAGISVGMICVALVVAVAIYWRQCRQQKTRFAFTSKAMRTTAVSGGGRAVRGGEASRKGMLNLREEADSFDMLQMDDLGTTAEGQFAPQPHHQEEATVYFDQPMAVEHAHANLERARSQMQEDQDTRV